MNSPNEGSASIAIPENRPVPPIKFGRVHLLQDKPQNSFMSVFSVLFLCCLAGLVGSYIYISHAKKIYQSDAKIKIELQDVSTLPGVGFEKVATARHETQINQYNIVSLAIAQGSVASCKVFDNLPKDEFGQEIDPADFVLSSLSVVADPDTPMVYDAT